MTVDLPIRELLRREVFAPPPRRILRPLFGAALLLAAALSLAAWAASLTARAAWRDSPAVTRSIQIAMRSRELQERLGWPVAVNEEPVAVTRTASGWEVQLEVFGLRRRGRVTVYWIDDGGALTPVTTVLDGEVLDSR